MDGGTNVPIINRGGSGSGGTGADLPTHLSSIAAYGGNKRVTLMLEYTNTDYISGIQINYKTDGYPVSPSDGESVVVEGVQTSVAVEGLTNGDIYYFRVFLFNEIDNVKYYQTDVTNAKASCTPVGIEIIGTTPLVAAEDHVVIVESFEGKITAPKGTRIIMGTGGKGRMGGYVASVVLPDDVVDADISVTVATGQTPYGTVVKIGSITYNSGYNPTPIQTKWGPVGGNGGEGAIVDAGNGRQINATEPTGAGGGGGAADIVENGGSWTGSATGTSGGNELGYGNNGGRGGITDAYYTVDGANGSSGKGGSGMVASTSKNRIGGGGGGGYAAGGGRGALANDDPEETVEYSYFTVYDGEPGTGIVVFELPA